MAVIGFVNNIKRRDAKQIVTVVLNYEELRTEKFILGEFVIVLSGGARRFLARVEDCYYAAVSLTDSDKNQTLATGRLNKDMDQSSVKVINFMHYDLALLGELPAAGTKFFAGVRDVPSLMDVEVYRPNQKELQQIVDAKVPGGTGQENLFQIGVLQYGTGETADGKAPSLPPFPINISFNVANLHPKRTAVFGKTGYGKSNLIKCLIALVHHHNPGTAQLIFDVNGEYAFTNLQGQGLLDIFNQAGKSGSIVVYSNRRISKNQFTSEVVKPIKFDVIENPEMAVALVVGKRHQRNRTEADYLETLRDPDMPPTVRAFWRCFCVVELGLTPASHHKARYRAPQPYLTKNSLADGYMIDDFTLAHELLIDPKMSKSDTVKNLTGKTGQFSFLKRFHYLEKTGQSSQESSLFVEDELALTNAEDKKPSDFFRSIKDDVKKGKIVILDLPSIDSNLLAPLSDKVAEEFFRHAQDSFLVDSVDQVSGNKNATPLLMYVEEAHNVLSDSQNTIFPRIAREGRKYGIGLVYSTQRPGSIDEDILTQSENFFVMHVGSEEDAMRLRSAKIAFASPICDFILTEPSVGVSYIYSEPYQPYVLSCKIRKFEDVLKDAKP